MKKTVTTTIRRTLVFAIIGAVIGVGWAHRADAASLVSVTSSCTDGRYQAAMQTSATADFVLSVIPILDGDELDAVAPGTVVTVDVEPGVHTFDWLDVTNGGDVVNGPHGGPGGSDEWRGADYFTFTVEIDPACEPVATIESTTTTTTTSSTTSTVAAASTTTAPAAATSSTDAPIVIADDITTSTFVLVGTAPPSPSSTVATVNTLPATGANSTPLIAAGVVFLGLGAVAILGTRRPEKA